MKFVFFLILTLSASFTSAIQSDEILEISHGPMLGDVSENSAAIWLRTNVAGNITITLSKTTKPRKQLTKKFKTSADSDNTCIARLTHLEANTHYQYVVFAGQSRFEGKLVTRGPSLKNKSIRMVYGYGYQSRENKMKPGTSIFMEMDSRKADLVDRKSVV
jgi:phosphodiesterase/alkaline phosphatase D-like protein